MFAGNHPSTPTTVDLAADLTLLLSRQALSEYGVACEAAQRAAERCAAPDRPSADALADLGNCRASVIDAEAKVRLVVDGLATRPAGKVSLDRASTELIGMLVRTALDRLSADFEASEDEILATATRIQRLRAVLDELGVETAAARKPAGEAVDIVMVELVAPPPRQWLAIQADMKTVLIVPLAAAAVLPAPASRPSLRPAEAADARGAPDPGDASPYAGSDKGTRDVARCRRDADHGEQR